MSQAIFVGAGLGRCEPRQAPSQPPSYINAVKCDVPLVVDLDGTLVKTDLLHEALTAALLRQPLAWQAIALWLGKGRAHLKARLAEAVTLDAATLPYREELLEWLSQEKAAGRRIVLATGASSSVARTVADHLGVFDDVLSSDEAVNLTSRSKRDALVRRFGIGGFAYVGNARADLPVWQAASQAHVAGHAPRLTRVVRERCNLGRQFDDKANTLAALVQAARPLQWAKNLLVLVPLLAAHLLDLWASAHALLAMLVFGLTASSVYILNDLIDLQDDRHHPRKRLRPLASGTLPVSVGWAAWPCLLVASFVIALSALPLSFTGSLAAYVALTLAYSLWLKRVAIADVVALALLYTVRLVAGAAAVGVHLSFWILSFSIFVFLSLALIKRYSELRAARANSKSGQLRGRGYGPHDLEFVAVLGASAAYTSVLVLALYVQDARTAAMYSSPQLIWAACPIFLFWISRAWLVASRGQMHDDPVVFAVRDPISWVTAALLGCVFSLASVVA